VLRVYFQFSARGGNICGGFFPTIRRFLHISSSCFHQLMTGFSVVDVVMEDVVAVHEEPHSDPRAMD
jgi:hypothetical protein